jgi:RimJ/RimL family protein N-acetyltransferase
MASDPPSKFAGPVTLVGATVRLVPLSIVHAEALVEAAGEDRSNYQWTPVPGGLGAMRAYIERAVGLAECGEAVPFATTLAPTGRVIGTTRFANFERHDWPPSNELFRGDGSPDGVEIGWTWLAASAQRTRANTEAKWLMLRHAFETWGVRVVRLKTDQRNERSRTAIERIGGKFDGIIRAHSPGADGTMRDSAYYSIVESEWPDVDADLRARLSGP